MKNYIIFILSFNILFSCTQVNSNGEKTITQGQDTLASVEISTSKIDALNTLSEMDEAETNLFLFKASGIEPGWLLEISEFKIKLVMDYGKDSVILDNKGGVINDKEDYHYEIQDKDISKSFSVKAMNKPCIDGGSGDKKDRVVVVKYKGKTYQGCGSFVK